MSSQMKKNHPRRPGYFTTMSTIVPIQASSGLELSKTRFESWEAELTHFDDPKKLRCHSVCVCKKKTFFRGIYLRFQRYP